MFKTAQKTLRLLITISTLMFTLFCGGVAYFVLGFHKEWEGSFKVAFWLGHDFSDGTQNLVQEMEGNLAPLKTEDLLMDFFIHAGPLNPDGTLPGDLQISSEVGALSEGTVYAWLGQLRSKIDLEDPTVRAQIVDSAGLLLSAGFEGIHMDIEPILRDDTAFVDLLSELHTAYPSALISVAMDEWQPHGLSQWVARYYEIPIESYWSTEQVQSILPYIDQLVVMTYDTGFNDARLYEWWVEQQSIALSRILEGSGVELLIGIPSYEQGVNFNPLAENLQSGLKGFLRGITNVRTHAEIIGGPAIYAHWEMSEEEWITLNAYFQTQP